MKYIFIFCLITYILCTTKRERPVGVADIYKGIKTKIYQCILDNKEASSQLKELANKNLNSEESQPLMFHTLQLTLEERLVIKNCKKEAFKKRMSKGAIGITPIGIDQAVHSVHSKKLFEKKSGPIRKLSITDGRLGAFNIGGIFPCLENAQPAIKVIRDSINLIRNKDYTGAIVNLYDNFSDVSQGLTYCINSIFPSD